MTVKHDCSGKIWGTYRNVSGRVYQCTRPATVERDGKWYCWQHDPERVKADNDRRRAEMLEQECNRWRGDWESVTAEMLNMQDRLAAMNQRATRAEALAALVNEETAALLERLSESWIGKLDDKEDARALAARIREALGEDNEG